MSADICQIKDPFWSIAKMSRKKGQKLVTKALGYKQEDYVHYGSWTAPGNEKYMCIILIPAQLLSCPAYISFQVFNPSPPRGNHLDKNF